MSQTMTRIARTLALATLIVTPAVAQQPASTLPKADELISRYVKAVGGADLIRKHSSMHMTGKFEVPAQGIAGAIEGWMSEGKLHTVLEITGIGSVRSGYDGSAGWQIHPIYGANILTGKQLDQMKEQADLAAVLTPEKYIKSRETLEKTSFDGKEAFKIRSVLLNDEETVEYFDANTGLSIGSVRKTETPMGAIETTSTVLEYQTIDGQLVATKIKQAAMGIEQIITMTKVEFAPVDPKVFELPKEIKALR